MKKNSIFLYAMTLIIAFCFTPSMMAKKISYMGYQYNGKINNHRHFVPKLRMDEWGSKIVLDEQIDNKPIELRLFSDGGFSNKKEYEMGVDSLLKLSERYDTELQLQFNYDHRLRESDVNKIGNFDKVITEKLLSNISIPKDRELIIYCVDDNDITNRVKVISVKNGVLLNRKQIAAAERKAQQAKDAKEQAAYNQLCKKYGKKYADAFMNGHVIVGMPEGLIKKYIHKIKSQSATSKTYYLLPYYGAPDYKRTMTVYVTNGRVTGFVDHR